MLQGQVDEARESVTTTRNFRCAMSASINASVVVRASLLVDDETAECDVKLIANGDGQVISVMVAESFVTVEPSTVRMPVSGSHPP